MDHVPEGELALYAMNPLLIAEPRRREIEAHIGSCAECQATHDFFVVGDEDLADADTWEPISGSSTYIALMAYGARVAAEDAEADRLLADYIAAPASAAWHVLTTRRAFRTGGVVRRLNAHAHATVEEDALVALTFADAAISIAEALPDDVYPARAVNQLRATAWKERANALMYLGRFPAAHDAIDRAERFFKGAVNSGLGLSMVALVRAGVFYEQQQYAPAMEWAERAERGFAHVGDEKRRMDAVFLRASITMEAGDPATARGLYTQMIDYGEATKAPRLIARGSYGAANAEADLGRVGEAATLFHRALVLFREVGPTPERIATDWGIARIVMREGRFQDAINRLLRVQEEYLAHDIVTDAALVGIDLAECLLALNRPQRIVTLARHLFQVFVEAGMLTGALSAIAYLQEAAAAEQLTPRGLRELRTFLKRAARQPSLAFVRPSE